MGCQVAACGGMINEVVLGKEALRAGVVASREVDLGEEEGVICITYFV